MPKLDVCQETTADTYQVQDYLACLMLATSVETFLIWRKKNDPDLFSNNLVKTMVHDIIDNQASIQDFDSPTLLKTNYSSLVTQ